MTRPVKQALVRILCGKEFGSGLLISPVDILTAGHVVKSDTLALLRVTGQAFAGVRAPVGISRHSRHDVAILHLDDAAASDGEAAHHLPDSEAVLANVGDRVTALGFSTIDRDLEERTLEYSAVDGVANMFVLNPAVPAGFSGGVLMRGDDVAGVTIARNTDSQTSYAYPIGQALDFVRAQAKGPVVYAPVQISALIRYPLGPMVPEHVVLAACYRLKEAFIERYGGEEAKQAVALANRERGEAGPPSGQPGLIDLNRLPNPEIAITGFWNGALANAGKKSPRMLAALLRVIGDDALSSVQREDRVQFLRRLENWGAERT